MHNKTIAELSADLRAGKYSSVELARAFLDRIKRHNLQLNAFVTVTEDQALTDARAADARLQAGNAGPLTGHRNAIAKLEIGKHAPR